MDHDGERGPGGVAEADAGSGPRGPISDPSATPVAAGPAGLLDESTAEAQLAQFKRDVIAAQITHLLAKGRTFFADVPKAELGKIEGPHKMRKEAAVSCRALLAAARAAHTAAKDAGDVVAAEASGIGIKSAYRTFEEDTAAWEKAFREHYGKMKKQKKYARDPFGPAALELITAKMISFKAPPGYSNHSNGKAVDFKTTQGIVDYVADSNQREGWRTTWLHQWLVKNASKFDFKPLSTEEWHWDYAK